MAFVRKKSIEMDGVTVVIAPLFSKQVDEMLSEQVRILDQTEIPTEEKVRALSRSWMQMIADGLNNANGVDPDHRYTSENIHEQFDKVMLKRLKDEIAEMSGMGISEGEAKAPSTSQS